MSLLTPLSPRQKTVWSLLIKGFSVSDIAKRLKTSPQYIHQTKRQAEAKLSTILVETAEAASIQIKRIRPVEGLLWGYHPGLNRETIISYTTTDGMKVWYWNDHPENVTDATFLQETKQYLLNLAEERKIELTEDEMKLHPAKLANHIFRQLIPEVEL